MKSKNREKANELLKQGISDPDKRERSASVMSKSMQMYMQMHRFSFFSMKTSCINQTHNVVIKFTALLSEILWDNNSRSSWTIIQKTNFTLTKNTE